MTKKLYIPVAARRAAEEAYKTLMAEYAAKERVCARCGDTLSHSDDVVCGYHHLEN